MLDKLSSIWFSTRACVTFLHLLVKFVLEFSGLNLVITSFRVEEK